MNQTNFPTLSLRPFGEEDMELLRNWLHKTYIRRWYNSPESWLSEVAQRQGAFSWIHHFIVMEGQTPIGFCQYYDCYNAKDLEDWYTITRPGTCFSIDYLLGEEGYLGKGYGKALVKLLTETVQNREKARQIIVQPDEDNLPSNRVLLANGYVYDGQKQYYCKLL